MRVKNEMETAVRNEMRRQRGGEKGSTLSWRIPLESLNRLMPFLGRSISKSGLTCRCPLCEADSLALSLTYLPPCYCRVDHYGLALSKVSPKVIEEKVRAALKRVGLRPRHSSREALPQSSAVKIIDFGLKEGGRMIGPLLERLSGACACEQCREDTLAFGLNRYAPKYGVSVGGKLRMQPHQIDFLRHELLEKLSEAAGSIARNPRHGGKDTL